MKKKSSFFQKVFSVMTVTVLLSQQVLPILVYAQSTDNVDNIPATETPTPTEIISETPTPTEVAVEPTNIPIPSLTPEVAITTDNSEIIIPKIDNGLNIEKYLVSTPTMIQDVVGKLQKFSNIVVNNVYVYALNSDVSVKFTKLPVGTNLSFTIEEVSVNLDGKTLTGYDIKSDMVDGEFNYELVLPNTVGKNAEVQYSEDGTTFNDVQNEKLTLDTVAVNADHFTIFIVTSSSALYSGTWIHYPTQGYQNGGVDYPTTIPSEQTATWSFTTLPSASYDVYVSWSTHSNRTTAAPYTLNSVGPIATTVNINQEQLADQLTTGGSGQWSGWYKLGTFSLDNTSSLVLTSVDNTSGSDYVIADTVALVDTSVAPLEVWVNGTYSQFGSNDYHVWGYDAFTTLQSAVTAVAPISGMVNVAAGTYTEVGQIIINKDLSIVGADKATTIIKPAQDTFSSGDARGWFLVQPANTFNISNVTLDGTGHSIFMGLYYWGDGTVNNINISNIKYSQYEGRGMILKGNVNVTNSTFTQMGRIAIQYYGGSGIASGNTMTGKGSGDWLDYGFDIGAGAIVNVLNNTISGDTGVASIDGSVSAAVMATTYFGPGTQATVTGNSLTNNSIGIAAGYDGTDTAVVVAHNNNISGNTKGIVSTNLTVDATNNWWGDASGPLDNKGLPGIPDYNNLSGTGNSVSSHVDYRPWFTDLAMTTLSSANAITIAATDVTSIDATLNGTNGIYDATGHSLWVSLNTFSTASSTIPSGVYSTVDLGSINANIPFSATLSSDFTGFSGVTPGTTYYFAAWSLVGGIWYPGGIMTFTTANGPVFIDTNVNGVLDVGEQSFNTIQAAINTATSGNTIHVTAGTYIEVGQIVIDKNLSIVGSDKITTIIKPSQDTGNSDDPRGWILVNSGISFTLKNVTLDGAGYKVWQAIRSHGPSDIENNIIKNMLYDPSTSYAGVGVVVYDGFSSNILNNILENIGREGIFVYGTGTQALVQGNTYIGKGAGDWLDYGIEVGGGGQAIIQNNDISNCMGIASSDGSTSAGIIGTTYYGLGTAIALVNNQIHDNSYGVRLGYDDGSQVSSDTTTVAQFNTNTFNNNTYDLDNFTLNNIDARNNIWSVVDQGNLDQIEAMINHNCANSIYVHGLCNDVSDYSIGGMVQYKDIGTPVNLGWNVASQSVTPNEMPLDLPCTTGPVDTNENSLAQNWSLVNGVNVKYQREVVFPSTAIGYFEAGSNNYTPFSSFGPGTEGLWGTRVRAYLDINNNGLYDSGEEVSAWSNQCQIIFDSTAPVITLLGANPQIIELGNAYVELGSTVLDNFDIGLTATINSSTVNTSLLGSYSVTYDAVDSAGNHAVQVTRTVNVVDTTAPAVPTLVSPVNGIYRHSADSNFSDWNDVTDLSDVVYYYQSAFDFGFTSLAYTSGPLTESMILNPGEPEISYFWHVKACDTVGNCSGWSTTWMINIDNTAPNFTITIPTTNQIIMGRLITINGTATDTNFNYYYCYVEDSHGEVGARDAACTTTWHAVTPAGVLGSVTLPNDLPDGNYVVHLIGYDKAMNSAETTQSFILDNTAPNANITSPLEGGYVRGTIDITGEFSDNNHEFNGIYMGFIGNDKDGNPLSWCHSEAPGFGIPDGTRTCSFDTTKLSDGSHTIEIWAMDRAGNWGTGPNQSINVIVDNTAPVVTAPDNIVAEATSASGANVAFPNTGSAIDNIDGSITPTCLPTSDSLFPLGLTTVVCSAVDNAGNTGTDSFTVEVKDTTAPSMPLDLGFSNPVLGCGAYTNIGSNTVNWDDSTDAVGVLGYDYHIEYPLIPTGRGVWDTTTTISELTGTLNPGLHQIKVRAFDVAGNKSEWTTLCDISYDIQGPVIDTIPNQSYDEGSYINNLEILNGKGITDDQKLDTFYLSIGYTPFSSSSSVNLLNTSFDISGVNGNGMGGTLNELINYAFDTTNFDFADLNGQLPIDTSISPEGVYTFRYWADDMAGNHSTCNVNLELTIDSTSYSLQRAVEDCSFTITINNVNPTVTLIGNQTIDEGQSASFTGSFTDPSYLADSPFYNPDLGFSIGSANSNVLGMLTQSIDALPISDGLTPNTPDDANWIATINYGEGLDVILTGPFTIPGVVTIPNHTYVNNGVYTATLTVCEGTETHNSEFYGNWKNLAGTDNNLISGEGNCDSKSVQVTVNNVVPTVSITASPSNNVAYGTTVTLTAAGLSGNAPLTYLWSGACGGTNQTYTLPSSTGTYSCTVIVTDVDGDTASANSTVVVRAFVVNSGGNTTTPEQLAYGIGDAFTPTPTPVPTGIVAGQETTGILGLLDQKCTTKYDASGYAYIDANNNNLKDTGEVVASNVEVIIYLENVLQDDGSTKNIDLVTVKTDASGLWKVNICAGSYKLRVNPNTLPSNTKLVKDSIDLTVKSDLTNENINLALVDNTSGFNWWWLVLPIGAIGILAYFYNGMKDSKVKLPRK